MEEYVKSGEDPTSVAVVAEDAAAVGGCVIAAAALTATQLSGNSMFDAAGSVAVGGLLGQAHTTLIPLWYHFDTTLTLLCHRFDTTLIPMKSSV